MSHGSNVAVWGSYAHGNFGDDLMAELFARQIGSWGHDVSVISPNPDVVEPGTAPVVPSLSDWKGRVVVLGGGAMLSSDSLLEYALRPATRVVEKEFADLRAFCKEREATVVPVSIGGGGKSVARILGNRRRFFGEEWAPRGSVRLRGDVALMKEKFGKDYEWYPDVLFSSRRVLELPMRAPQRDVRIGVNLNAKKTGPVLRAVRGAVGDSAEIVPITTHSSFFDNTYEWGSGTEAAIEYEDLHGFLAELRTLDVIISDKLHLGLVSSTMGVPFLPYQAKAKTVSLHHEVGAGAVVAESPEVLANVVASVVGGQRVPSLATAIQEQGLDELAEGHLQMLREELDRLMR